jgi:hypothetical protein
MVVTATPAPTQSPYDDNAPITVWIDQPRQPAIDAFIKANPDKANLIKTVVVDREQFPSKVLLFNNTNQGWPDVVFAEPRLVARVADAAHNFPLDSHGKYFFAPNSDSLGDIFELIANNIATRISQ